MPRLLEVTRSRALCIHRLDADGASLQLAGEQSYPQTRTRQLLTINLLPTFIEWLQQPNDPLISMDMPRALRCRTLCACPGMPPILARRCALAHTVLGLLSCYRLTNRGYSVDEIALVTALAEQIGLLLEADRLRSEVQAKAALEERHRLARDLHDSVTQSLYSLSLLSRAAREALRDGDTQHLDNSLSELELDTLHALREMRLLLYELRPADLESAGLVAALEFRLNTVERRAGLQIEFNLDQYVSVLPTLEVEVYYIVVEALNNVVKHAAARRACITLATGATTMRIRISDNGVGFDERPAGRGLGLRSMRERIARLNGHMTIVSEPAGGTVIEARSPW